jgi:hypothetical protein
MAHIVGTMSPRSAGAVVLLVALPLALGGCFLAAWLPGGETGPPVSGPAPYVEDCRTCHISPVAARYAESLHAAKGIQCGQCHTPGGHPDFTQPVRDGKCGGCHLAQLEQTLASKHFAARELRALESNRAARAALRRDGFTAAAPTGRRFVGDAGDGELGGRLCVACHYDEHRLGLGAVRQSGFCTGCHGPRDEHYSLPEPGVNRCTVCHVRVGTTERGQVIDSHRFAMPGAAP